MSQTVPPRLSRRSFLKVGVGLVGGYALVKVGARALIGPPVPARAPEPARLKHLSRRQARIATAALVAIAGPAAEAAWMAGKWEPAEGMDGLLERLAPDQRGLVGMALHLFEEWTWGLRGFSSLERDEQLEVLERWRVSDMALQRSTWGMLHAAAASSFSGLEAGWEVMGYPGPCVALEGAPGRRPGQSVPFDWDERVP